MYPSLLIAPHQMTTRPLNSNMNPTSGQEKEQSITITAERLSRQL